MTIQLIDTQTVFINLIIDMLNAGSALANRKTLVEAVQSRIEIGKNEEFNYKLLNI